MTKWTNNKMITQIIIKLNSYKKKKRSADRLSGELDKMTCRDKTGQQQWAQAPAAAAAAAKRTTVTVIVKTIKL